VANVAAIRSVGNSLVKLLDTTYPKSLRDLYPVTFRLVSSGELADQHTELDGSLTIYLYRVTVNDHLRNARAPRAPEATPPLPLNLHYLMSVWSKSADQEHTVLGWAMRQLHQHAILDASTLMPDGGWAPDEVIHLLPEELSTEDMLRLWDAIDPAYRLSASYVARVVTLAPDNVAGGVPVVATRIGGGE
jgi:hypothetical protein